MIYHDTVIYHGTMIYRDTMAWPGLELLCFSSSRGKQPGAGVKSGKVLSRPRVSSSGGGKKSVTVRIGHRHGGPGDRNCVGCEPGIML